MGTVYRSESHREAEDRRYDRQTIGILLAVGALIFAVPAILLVAVLS